MCVREAIRCVCGHVGLYFLLSLKKQSVSINVDLNDPACQQQTFMRVVFSARDKVKKAILGIIKDVLARY